MCAYFLQSLFGEWVLNKRKTATPHIVTPSPLNKSKNYKTKQNQNKKQKTKTKTKKKKEVEERRRKKRNQHKTKKNQKIPKQTTPSPTTKPVQPS